MRRLLAFTLAVCLAASARPAAAPAAGVWAGVGPLMEPRATMSIKRALTGAVDWLARDECQQIFTEFHDQAGRPLTARLEELQVTAADFLRLILWRDGTYTSQCEHGPLAYTTPGSRLVFVCSRKFADLTFSDQDLARAVVIHEALHSLGLGENPPSSLEITARVRARCARATDKGHR
jgi:hypothetical protein